MDKTLPCADRMCGPPARCKIWIEYSSDCNTIYIMYACIAGHPSCCSVTDWQWLYDMGCRCMPAVQVDKGLHLHMFHSHPLNSGNQLHTRIRQTWVRQETKGYDVAENMSDFSRRDRQ